MNLTFSVDIENQVSVNNHIPIYSESGNSDQSMSKLSMLLHGYQQTGSKAYMNRTTGNSQYNGKNNTTTLSLAIKFQ
jgi:hypothetical protein